MAVSARAVKTLERRGRTARLPAALPLALWRMRRTWGLLLVAQLGMAAAAMLVWAVPLFGQVALVAGLQGLVDSSPGMDTFHASIHMTRPTAQLLMAFTQSGATLRATDLRAWHLGTPRITLNSLPVVVSAPGSPPPVVLSGEPAALLAADLRVVAGRLPVSSASALEAVVTQATAKHLDVTLGGTFTVLATPPALVRVVGIVAPVTGAFGTDHDSYLANIAENDPMRGYAQNNPLEIIATSDEAITAYTAAYDWSHVVPVQHPAFNTGPGCPQGPRPGRVPGGACNQIPLWEGWWTARANFAAMSGQDLTAFLNTWDTSSTSRFSARLNQLIATDAAAQVQQAGFVPGGTGGEFGSASNYGDYETVALIVIALVWLLLGEVLGLVLLALGRIASLLVERQEPLIATLRSRGASRGQIFGAFAVQTLVLAVVALALGGLLAVPVARGVSAVLLPASEQRAVGVLDAGSGGFGLAGAIAAMMALVITAAVMLRATGRAAALNTLTARQEAARPVRIPTWQRLHLDVLAAVLAVLGYGLYALANALAAGQGTPTHHRGPLSDLIDLSAFLAPAFLMVAGALLFQRVFPPLLRLGERLAARGHGVVGMLALAQLARAARQTTRIAVPLSLATCFALFTLGAYASVTAYITDGATLQAGADFSGLMSTPAAATPAGIAARTATYANLAGVRSAAVGYRGATLNAACDLNSNACPANAFPIQFAAVDAEHYATTALWPSQDAAQPVAGLMARLSARRDDAIASGIVPAILDANTARLLSLQAGATFSLFVPTTDGFNPSSGTITGTAVAPKMRFLALAVVPYLAGEQVNGGNGPNGEADGAVLVDYTSFAAAYRASVAPTATIAPNYVWLRTASDPAALARVRAALASGPLAIGPLTEFVQVDSAIAANDRQALIDDARVGQLVLAGVFGLGAAAALLLALCGTLIASLVAARERGLSFALLRALGAEPRRIWRLVAAEQGIVYTTALALGVFLAALLTAASVPPLTDLLVGASNVPARIVWPWSELGAMLGALALICIIATAAAAWVAARPSLGAILRLNED